MRGNEPAAAVVLARGGSPTEAAREAGVSTRTVTRWQDRPDFTAQVRQVRSDFLEYATGKLAEGASQAVDTLRDEMTNGKGQARVQAARVLLDSCLALRESLDLEHRLAALEHDQEVRR